MPILSFEVAYAGRPIVELYVAMATKDARVLRGAGGRIPGPLAVEALVDTGAKQSCLDLSIVTHLGLELAGETDLHTASTGTVPERVGLHLVDRYLAGDKPGTFATNVEVVDSDRLAGLKVGMLLGRDILDRCLLVYDGPEGRFTLAYDAPEV